MIKSWKNLLSNNKFIYIWLSQILSQITINILNFALVFTYFEKTGSTIATSLIWISYAIPAFFVGPIASATVDMIDRRKILVFTNLFQSLTIFLYAMVSDTHYFIVYAVVMIYSLLNQFYVPAEFSTLPFVTKKKLLPEANSTFLITQQGSLIIGFGFAGFFLKIFGFQNTLIFCSILLFAAFISTIFLPSMKSRQKIPTRLDKAVVSFYKNIYLGYKFISQNKFVLAPFFIMMFMQVSLTIVAINAPALASEVFRIPLNYTGVFIILPGGIGAVLASLNISRLLNKGTRKIKIINNSIIFLTLPLLLWIFIPSYINFNLRILFSFISIAVMGFFYMSIIIPTQTLLQQKTPFGFRGRVFGNYGFLVTIISIFPVLLSGTITEILGIRTLMAIIIIGMIILSLFLRKKERKHLLQEDYN